MFSVLTLVLYILFPFLCILAVPLSSRHAAFAERLVSGIALYEFLLLAIGLILGLTDHLTAYVYPMLMSLTALVLIVPSYRNGVRLDLFRHLVYFRTGRGKAALVLSFLVVVTFALELGFDSIYGTRHSDALWYHIPRVVFWIQQHGFEAWTTPSYAQIGLPVGADLILAHKILMGRGWQGTGLVTMLLTIGAVACVYIAALDLRLSRWHATISAVLFASFPAIGLRIWSVNSDIAAAFPALASYVALRRIGNTSKAISVFLLLNGIAIACKPTVAPLLLLLDCITLWQCRQKIRSLRSYTLPFAAAVLAAGLVISSYWPVYRAFSDFLGGDYSRAHRTTNITEFINAVSMHSGHWLLEPLGYVSRFNEEWEIEVVKSVYNFLGAGFERLPEIWKPHPGPESGYTGLVPVLALPVLLAGLAAPAGLYAGLLFLLGYVPLSGMILPQPFFLRYNVVLLAGFALMWGGTRIFLRGKRRWLLAGIAALNVCALLGVVAIHIYLDKTKWSQPGGLYDYISDGDRRMISKELNGKPLLVITDGELEALLYGPDIAFPISYVVCPADGSWEEELRISSDKSNWLAFVHNGNKSIVPGPEWGRPGFHACSEISKGFLERKLSGAGWKLYRSNSKVDLWRFELPPNSATQL